MVTVGFIDYIARGLTGLLHTLIENDKIVDVTVQHIIFRVFFAYFNNKKGKVGKVSYDKVPQCSVK